MIALVPTQITGTIGSFRWMAAMNGPFLNGSSWPSRLRVPSGKITKDEPFTAA
jgi:hypothetical protein